MEFGSGCVSSTFFGNNEMKCVKTAETFTPWVERVETHDTASSSALIINSSFLFRPLAFRRKIKEYSIIHPISEMVKMIFNITFSHNNIYLASALFWNSLININTRRQNCEPLFIQTTASTSLEDRWLSPGLNVNKGWPDYGTFQQH